MTVSSVKTPNVRKTLDVNGKQYDYYSIPEAAKQIGDVTKLPFSLKVLLENMLPIMTTSVYVDDIKAVVKWLDKKLPTTKSHTALPVY